MKTQFSKTESFLKPIHKGLALTGIGLCVLCCSLPVMGVITGIGAMSGVAFYLEKVGIGLLLLALILAGIAWQRKRRKNVDCTASCTVDCDCSSIPSGSETSSISDF